MRAAIPLLPFAVVSTLLLPAVPGRAAEPDAPRRALEAELESYLAQAPDLDPIAARAGGRRLAGFLAAAGTGRSFGPSPRLGAEPDHFLLAAEPRDAAAPRAVETLPESTVRAATLSEQPLRETVPAVNLVERRTMDERNAQGISEALRWQPGLWQTQSSGATLGTPVVRGYQGNQVLLVLDGIRVSHDRTPTGPGPDWENFNRDLVERIEVLRSPDSVLYGTGAIGGVTAVYSGFPASFPEEGRVHGGQARVAFSGGGEDFWRLRAGGYAASPGWRVAAEASAMGAQDMETPDGPLVPTEFDLYGASIRGEWRVDASNTLGAAFFAMAKSWDGNYLAPSRPRNQDLGREIAIVRWNNTAGNAVWDELETRVGVVHNSQKYARTDILDVNQYDIWTVQVTALVHTRVGEAHDLTYGLDSHVDFDDIRREKASGVLREVPKGSILYIGALVQDEWRVCDRVKLVAGARIDGVWASTDPDPATTDPLLDAEELRIDQGDAAFTGKLGVLYDATDTVSFTANYSRGYRHPSLTDLAGLLQAPDEIVVGNPDVDPEYSNNFEVGAHYHAPRVRGDLVAFYTRNSNAIIRTYGTVNGMSWYDRDGNGVQDPDEDFYLTRNAGKYDFYGLELDAQVDVCRWATVFGNLTTWRGSIHPDPTEPIGIPDNFTLGVRVHDDARWWAEFTGHFVARFDDIPQDFYDAEAFFKTDPQDEDSPTIRNDHSLPGYSIFDLRAGLRISERSSLTVGVGNLFDRKYRSFGDRHDGAARTFYLSFAMDF